MDRPIETSHLPPEGGRHGAGDQVEDRPSVFLNFYRCSVDDTRWTNSWSSMCNDRCPTCGVEIEPFRSEDI